MRPRRVGGMVWCAVLLMAGLAVAAESPAPPFEAQVSRDEANVRAGSTVGSETLATLPRGSHVSVIGEHAGWYRIRLPQSARCYVAAQYVDAKGLVIGEHVNVRAGAGRQYAILGYMRRGDRVRVLETQGAWARVEPPLGLGGWVRADLVAPMTASAAAPTGATTTAAPPAAASSTAQAPPDSSGLAATTVAALAAEASTATTGLPPTATGILETTRGFRQPSKHRLTQAGRTIFYLQSTSVDLSQYKHQHVAVWGTLDPTVRSPHPLVSVQRVERAD